MSHKLKNPRPQGRRATFKPNAAGRVSQQRLREQLAADWPKISSARKLTTTQRRVNLIFPVFLFFGETKLQKSTPESPAENKLPTNQSHWERFYRQFEAREERKSQKQRQCLERFEIFPVAELRAGQEIGQG
jgi:hypothetical protein